MAIDFACRCGKRFRVNEEHAGKQAKCSACASVLTVPQPVPDPTEGTLHAQLAAITTSTKAEGRLPRRGRKAAPRDNRLQRWYVLTGGKDPAVLFEIPKVLLQRAGRGNRILADLIFTEVGLLVVPYQEVEQFAGMGQLYGGLVAVASEKWTQLKAFRHYDKHAPAHRAKPPVERFLQPVGRGKKDARQPSPAGFLPADEIKGFVQQRDRGISYEFRRTRFAFVLTDAADRPKLDLLAKWHATARRSRQAASGGPPSPKLAALLEWCYRPKEPVPEWIFQAISKLAARRGGIELPKTDLGSRVPTENVVELIKRLRAVARPQASALAEKVGASMLRETKAEMIAGSWMTVFGIPAILCLIFLIRHGNEVPAPSMLGLGTAVDVIAYVLCLLSAISLCGGIFYLITGLWSYSTMRQVVSEERSAR